MAAVQGDRPGRVHRASSTGQPCELFRRIAAVDLAIRGLFTGLSGRVA